MGGALAEVTAAVAILSKVGGGGALLGSAGIFITVQSLGELANSLKSFGEMQWDEIGRGLAAMGGALAEVGIVTGALGKLAGFSGVLGSGAIFITVQSLQELATSLQSFASMAWDEIGRGLAAMGGALAEVGIVTGALGKIAGFSGILGSGAILIVVQGLQDLATALQSFGSMSWDEIGRGLAAMGGALLEVGAVSGGLGMLTGISGLFGAGTIWIAVQGLQDLATALQSFGSMSWDEIGRGLVAMGGALLEVGAISGALGAFTGIAGLVGAGTITLASQGLDEIANALLKFSSMSWDEIGRGLTAMAGALGEVALGGLLSTFSGLGAAAISEMAEPLGQLADSVKRWTGVTVPDGLGLQLGVLASGVKAFNFAGWGADAIAAMATPLGSLADSISKWSGVTVPEGLGAQLSSLAPGIESFNFAGWGADAIANLATPLGDLAGSVQKWSTVTITEELGTDLTSLADGIKAFSFAFVGGWSISSLVQPLKDLAGAVNEWNNTTIPDGMEEKLTSLANGVKSFNTSFFGGWNISGLVEPLTNLAGAVDAWADVNVTGIGAELTELSSGLTTLGEVGVKNLLNSLDGAAEKAVQSITKMLTGINTAINAESPRITNSFKQMMEESLKAISSREQEFNSSGQSLVTELVSGITSKKDSAQSAFTSTLLAMITSIRSQYSGFYSAGMYLVQGFANGITQNTYIAKARAQAMALAARQSAEAALGVHSPSRVFYGIGTNVVEGFANGIEDNLSMVASSGEKLGDSVTKSTEDALDKADISGVNVDVATVGMTDPESFATMGSTAIESFAAGMEESLPAVQESASLIADTIEETINSALSNIKIGSTISDLGASEKKFGAMGSDLLTSFYTGMTEASAGEEQNQQQGPGIIAVFDQMIASLQEKIEGSYHEMFYNSGVSFITNIIDGINSEQSNLINTLTTLLMRCYNTLYNYRPKFYNIGAMICEAIAQAVRANADSVIDAVTSVCAAALKAGKSVLGIASPSKEFYKVGDYAMQGFVNGIIGGGSSVGKAAETVAQKAISTTRDAIARLAETVTNGIDTEPTIRPVLDLSNVESGTRRISAMFSRNQAMSIGSRMNPGSITEPESQNGVSETPTGATYSFVQNNYSPKALSRIEIYRQTNNQFSAMVRRRATT